MKLQLASQTRRSGFALIMVLILVGVSLAILAGAMNRSQTVAILNQRNNDFATSSAAAEAAVEKAYARMAYDFQSYGVAGVSNNWKLNIYQTNIPNENAYWNNYQFTDAQGNVGRTYVNFAYSYSGPLPSSYVGLFTTNAPVYRIVSNVTRVNPNNGVVGAAQEDVLLALVPLTTWAIFYNGKLEFTQCATMSVNGRVHANGDIYVGTSASLTFNSGVSTTGTLTAPADDGLSDFGTNQSSWNTTFNGTPAYTTNVASVTVSMNMTNSHFLIDIPPAGEDSMSSTGQQRLYNEAQMIFIITNAPSGSTNSPTIIWTLQNSVNGAVPGNDSSKLIYTYTNATTGFLFTNLPFLSLTNQFFDQRERDTNLITQIDIGKYSTWAATNAVVQGKLPSSSQLYPTILYIADQRIYNTVNTATRGTLAGVRLANGAQLPSNNNYGFTIATPNPLYVLGNYNVQTASSAAGAAAGSTNTAATVPAALLSDALTVLSPGFTDSETYTAYDNANSLFDATSMTINAAIITGTMPTTGTSGTTFSGGVHNLPRLLEDWSGKDLWLNTSILRLWDSNMATTQFRNPQGFNPVPVRPYYNPPTRHYTFDQNFLNPAKVPPGIPLALVPIRFGWCVPPAGSTNTLAVHN
jgi:hypothetical protein